MNVVVKFIENNEVYINIIAFILTLIGTSVSVCSWWKIRGYKKEILGKLDYVDFSAFLSKFYSVVQDLSKTSDSENNNRGGKLYKILDDISVLMTETLNILKNLSDADKDKIKRDKALLKGVDSKYYEHFERMAKLAQILKDRRVKNGYLSLDIPETEIILDENGIPVDIRPYEINFANEIIEQFMLTANETIAEKFYWLEAPFIYRVHEKPSEEKIDELNKKK